MRDVLTAPQVQDGLHPLLGVGVAVVVGQRIDTQRLEFGQEPAADHVDRQPAAGDVGDVGRDLGEHQRIEQQRLDRPDQLDPLGGLGKGGQGGPRFQDVVLGVAGMDHMLGHQCRVIASTLGMHEQIAGAPVAGVRQIVRVQAGTVVAVDRRPHPEAWSAHDVVR